MRSPCGGRRHPPQGWLTLRLSSRLCGGAKDLAVSFLLHRRVIIPCGRREGLAVDKPTLRCGCSREASQRQTKSGRLSASRSEGSVSPILVRRCPYSTEAFAQELRHRELPQVSRRVAARYQVPLPSPWRLFGRKDGGIGSPKPGTKTRGARSVCASKSMICSSPSSLPDAKRTWRSFTARNRMADPGELLRRLETVAVAPEVREKAHAAIERIFRGGRS